jgi:zinc/manganese transport system ATP-binding protein
MSELAVKLSKATLKLGNRVIWENLDLDVKPGEFIAILGPNGAGKTTLLRVLLGLLELTSGAALVRGNKPHKGNSDIGYIPQQKSFDVDLPIRGRDLVFFGLNGHRYGLPSTDINDNEIVAKIIKEVDAEDFVDSPIGRLSGGEQQRLRIAQALVGNPSVILCDEPLLSLDLAHQQKMTALINKQCQKSGSAVLFVTHEINPILTAVDRVLYLVGGKWAIGSPDEVMTSKKLSELYGTDVDVLRVRDRIVVVGTNDPALGEGGVHHH